MGSRIALVRIVDVGVRIDVDDGELAVPAAHRAKDRMRDGVIAAEADQRSARGHRGGDTAREDVPRISGSLELDVAAIDDSPSNREIYSRFTPAGICVGHKLPANQRRRLRSAPQE